VKSLDSNSAELERFFTGEPSQGPDGLYRVAMSLRKENGQRIRCLLTSPGDQWQGVIVILSGFGRTIRHSNALALAAAHHGYATVRFDPSNHTGDSDGELLDGTMSQITEDLLFVCTSVRRSGWSKRLFVIAASTFARCAIRATRHGLPVDGLILPLPVVDLTKTLASVTGEDLVGGYRSGRIQITDVVQILSQEISARFLANAVEQNYCDLEPTRAELRETTIPVAMIAAERDDWVSVTDIITALEPERPNRKLYVLEDTNHNSYSFGFLRAITQTTMQALVEMTGERIERSYEVTFSKFTRAVETEKKILSRAREAWRIDE
jgi:pimeloyl-ACP methyl ester carboxylesterase